MNGKRLAVGMLLGLGAGTVAAYLGDPKFGKRRRAALARNTRKFLKKAALATADSMADAHHRLAGAIAGIKKNF